MSILIYWCLDLLCSSCHYLNWYVAIVYGMYVGSTSGRVLMCILFVPHSACHVFLLYYSIVGGHMLYYSNTFR